MSSQFCLFSNFGLPLTPPPLTLTSLNKRVVRWCIHHYHPTFLMNLSKQAYFFIAFGKMPCFFFLITYSTPPSHRLRPFSSNITLQRLQKARHGLRKAVFLRKNFFHRQTSNRYHPNFPWKNKNVTNTSMHIYLPTR